jgi:hypothetical protein
VVDKKFVPAHEEEKPVIAMFGGRVVPLGNKTVSVPDAWILVIRDSWGKVDEVQVKQSVWDDLDVGDEYQE